ncbi:MAG: peptide deformylase [Geminicoccaceae bacterium]|nr:peptide deformylase [Geminicoccaceae bacterium]
MPLLEIIEAPDPRLTAHSAPVERIDADLLKLMDDMLETMYAAPGIGLAAPQVGVGRRVFVADVAGEEERKPLFVINPEIVWVSDEVSTAEEGCLSLPKQFGEVTRPARVRLCHLDREGQQREIEAEGLLARCLQHEIDHLDGVLFTDHLSTLKRNMIMRRLAKAKRFARSAG